MDVKKVFLDFFEKKGHIIIPSAPIVPENDPTCLFNTAGMQPLVPYLMGQAHPLGNRLCDVQKCVRCTDLEEVGDETHHTFFEMLGNWSLGDYFKEESIAWSFELLTQHFHIPVERLAVTVFQGNDVVERDNISASLWKQQGIPESRIAYLGEEDNWWGPAAEVGPCGPDTEIFYYRGETIPELFDPNDSNWVEIWNNVFMEYEKKADGTFVPLSQKNVDTGMGVERITAVLENVRDNYASSLWKPCISKLEELTGLSYASHAKSMRIIADHIRSVVMICGDEALVKPSNTDQGYIVRRLIRRALRHAKKLGLDLSSSFDTTLATILIDQFSNYYPELDKNKEIILSVLQEEKQKFSRTLEKGLKEFEKICDRTVEQQISGLDAFHLYDTYGFPIELTLEMAQEHGKEVDLSAFEQYFQEHQEKSRVGAEQKFKGGLKNHSDQTIQYHTATHLLNAALKEVLGSHVHQKGSNITEERMRFDFSNPTKVTKEQLEQVEALVNHYIEQSLAVTHTEMRKSEAIQSGAEAMFIDKYGDIVTVYTIGDVSKEICGGPHVTNTQELGHFKIVKEEASSAGVRRIKAILEPLEKSE